MNETLEIGDLEFQIRRSERRRTLEIIVDRHGELIVAAPNGADRQVLIDFIQDKRVWVYSKLARRESMQSAVSPKEFVSGEGFPYLGRSYRLLVVPEQPAPVKLEHGRFKMRRQATFDGRRHMVDWYAAHAQTWLGKRVDRFAPRLEVEPHELTVRDLSYRWGSCGPNGRLSFHWRCVLLPPQIADYIVVHELVHLAAPSHGTDFWRRVERAIPDFKQRKAWLAQQGAGYQI